MLCDDDGCTKWPKAEPVVVKGEMSCSGVEQTRAMTQSNRDNDTGLSYPQQCSGGVPFRLTSGNLPYFSFSYTGQYGQPTGAYMYEKCNQITN